MMPRDGDAIVQEVDKSRRVLDTQISALSDQEHLASLSIGGSTPTPSASTPYTGNTPSVDSNSSANAPSVKTSITYGAQTELPALPIPGLEETLNKFLGNLEALQSKSEHEASKRVVLDFLQTDGPRLQKLLVEYDQNKRACGEIGSYVEEFWNDSYLAPDSSVVLHLNPFFVLEDSPDPKIAKDPIQRASMLCFTALKMASQLRFEMLKPDQFRGKALCMDQFKALFATARTPVKDQKDTIQTYPDSGHVAVLFKSQIYIFHALWEDGHVAVDEGDIVDILSAIHSDAEQADPYMVSQSAIGLLTSLGRNEWAEAREEIVNASKRNRDALKLIDSALFFLVLDDYIPLSKHDAASNMLHGSYNVQHRKKKNDDEDDDHFQAGSCCNRWYDKLQIIVCGDGTAGINFEHSTVDGHTALRFVSDIYAETVIKFARSITKQIHSPETVPHVIQAKVKRAMTELNEFGKPSFDIGPKKIAFDLSESTKRKLFFAETALGDEIVASDIRVLEFQDFGKEFIISNKMSPDSFVQLSMMLAYYRLYGKIVCTYEPVLTKAFYHGRTEAMRSATVEAKIFCEIFCDKAMDTKAKEAALRTATRVHSQLVKECARGKGVDRHLFALKCIAERGGENIPFFESKGWKVLNYTILSTSNCGNPSLRLFGFGPVVPDGFGIGYIIKDRSIYFSISSKHRQTSRYASTLESTLREMSALFHHKKKNHYSTPTRRGARDHRTSEILKCQMACPPDGTDDNNDNDAYGDVWGVASSGHVSLRKAAASVSEKASTALRDNWGESTPTPSPKSSQGTVGTDDVLSVLGNAPWSSG